MTGSTIPGEDGAPLVFLHTAEANLTRFSAMLAERALGRPIRHILEPEPLAAAAAAGRVTPAVEAQVTDRLREAVADGAHAVCCTCSTIGGVAEDAGGEVGVPVMRIDRPMAERALELGRTILVAACLASTVEPTRSLIEAVARDHGKDISLRTLLIEEAWALFERGDADGYAARIAEALRTGVGDADVVVLAQASMTGAADLCADLGVPILSSPELGLDGFLDRFGGP